MQASVIDKYKHAHDYAVKNTQGEKNTLYVLILTAITMVAEVVAGSVYGSMALLADGWHMGTHVAAFMIAIFAYQYARKNADNPAFSFGTGKVNVLGGFASAIALSVVSIMMLLESFQRLFNPHTIHFNEAIFVAVLGLVVNLASALLLKDHDHDHDHDHNLHAAYMHVLADALTSVLAIVALLCGKFFGWDWMDPIMGVVGAIIITRWSIGLLKQTSPILLDASIDPSFLQKIRMRIEDEPAHIIADLHVWKVGANHYAAIISLVAAHPNSVDYYKQLLADVEQLAHITVEINPENSLLTQ